MFDEINHVGILIGGCEEGKIVSSRDTTYYALVAPPPVPYVVHRFCSPAPVSRGIYRYQFYALKREDVRTVLGFFALDGISFKEGLSILKEAYNERHPGGEL